MIGDLGFFLDDYRAFPSRITHGAMHALYSRGFYMPIKSQPGDLATLRGRCWASICGHRYSLVGPLITHTSFAPHRTNFILGFGLPRHHPSLAYMDSVGFPTPYRGASKADRHGRRLDRVCGDSTVIGAIILRTGHRLRHLEGRNTACC
ncbi:hypothetical protein BDV59DRAFT_9820 [Aspergillus ambiguus]|uniref:uncharacterized protein n=1 Tax=Aspergillus ambiguus TaxID=176160 RepID=UPI003CCCE562